MADHLQRAAFLVATLCGLGALAIHHELWRDEAHAWLLVAEYPPLPRGFIYPGEGHPPGWHALLYVGWLVWPHVITLRIIQFALMAVTVGSVSFWGMLSWPQRYCVACGYFFLWQYGTLARCYSLTLASFAVFIAIHWLRQPAEGQPSGGQGRLAAGLALGVLCLSHLHALPLSGLLHLSSRYAKPGGASRGYLLAWSMGAIASLAVIGISAIGHTPRTAPQVVGLGNACLGSAGAFAPELLSPDPAALLVGLALFTGAAVRVAEPLMVGGYVAIISAGMWLTDRWAVWHCGFAFLGWLASACLRPAAWDRGWVSALLAINAVAGLVVASADLAQPYGCGEAVAHKIVERGLENERWAAVPSWAGSVAAAILERPFFCLEDEAWHATVIAQPQHAALTREQRVERLGRFVVADASPVYVLVAEGWLHWLTPGMRGAGFRVDELGVLRGFAHENIGVLRLRPEPPGAAAAAKP